MRYIFSGKFRLKVQTKILIQYTLKKIHGTLHVPVNPETEFILNCDMDKHF